MVYANRNLLGVVFDRAEEAFEECPCNEDGRPRHQKTAPAHLKSLRYLPEDKGGGTEKMIVAADMRVDSTFPARLHSHVRLQGASEAENAWIRSPILDGLVTGSLKGEIHISLVHPPPPDFQRMEWNLYHAGSTGVLRVFVAAILLNSVFSDLEGHARCNYYSPGAASLCLWHLSLDRWNRHYF
jgi:regulator of nonsense transcripts 1